MNIKNVIIEKQRKIMEARYQTIFALTVGIVQAMEKIPPYPTNREAQDIFREWLREEDGELAMARLANLIIY